eukprot:449755_1
MFKQIGRICHLKLPIYQSIRYATAGTQQVPPKLNELSHNLLTIDHTTTPKPKSPYNQLQFGKEFTDHLLEVDWSNDYGWHDPLIKPYGSFSIDPAASCLHYALQAFEGMKAYIDDNDRIRLFRPNSNMQRLNASCEALFFPTFDSDEFMQCVHELLKVDREWIPRQHGYSLYIRPTIISTYPYIGVAAAQNVKLYCICSPVGPYYPEGFKPVSLLATTKYVRAWPGGVGNKKLGSNYGPTIRPQHEAAQQGYTQIMWLFPDGKTGKHFVSEVGTMNQFFFWKTKSGEKELITAPLDGTILPGIMRDSVLTLCKDWNRFKVTERKLTMNEVIEAIEDGRMLESFGTGTAAIISPVGRIGYKGKDYIVPVDKNDINAKSGPLAKELFETILGIQYGEIEYKDWSVIVPEK